MQLHQQLIDKPNSHQLAPAGYLCTVLLRRTPDCTRGNVISQLRTRIAPQVAGSHVINPKTTAVLSPAQRSR